MKLKNKLLMPIMGVAAVAGAVVPCAVSCKTEHSADSATIKVVYDDYYETGYKFQFNTETGVAADGELTVTVSWHSVFQDYYYVPEGIYLVINGKTITARSETNSKGFLYQSYSINGATLSMPDELIPYDAEIEIHIIALIESEITDSTEVKYAEEDAIVYYQAGYSDALEWDVVSSTKKPTDGSWTTEENPTSFPEVEGANTEIERGDTVGFGTNVDPTAPFEGTLGLTASMGYYYPNYTWSEELGELVFANNEYTHNALDIRGTSRSDCVAQLTSLYYGDKPLTWHYYNYGSWRQYMIIIDAPYPNGKWVTDDGKTQPITGTFEFYRNCSDLSKREAGIEILIGQLSE